MRKILLAITVLLFIVSIGYPQDQPFQLTIESDKQIYKVGEEIWIQVTIRNASERKQKLFASFIISSGNIKNAIDSPVKFSDNTFNNNPYHEGAGILQPKQELVLKYNLYNLKWGDLPNSLSVASKPFKKYIKPGKYSVSFESVIVDQKDYTPRPNNFTSNTIVIEVVEKKIEINREKAIKLVQDYIRKNNINVKDINTPSEVREHDDSWSISYAIEQEPVPLPPFRSFNIDKDTGETYEIPRE